VAAAGDRKGPVNYALMREIRKAKLSYGQSVRRPVRATGTIAV